MERTEAGRRSGQNSAPLPRPRPPATLRVPRARPLNLLALGRRQKTRVQLPFSLGWKEGGEGTHTLPLFPAGAISHSSQRRPPHLSETPVLAHLCMDEPLTEVELTTFPEVKSPSHMSQPGLGGRWGYCQTDCAARVPHAQCHPCTPSRRAPALVARKRLGTPQCRVSATSRSGASSGQGAVRPPCRFWCSLRLERWLKGFPHSPQA